MPEPGRWELVWSHRDRLIALARPRCVSRQDAEDCVHDAMLRCVELDRVDPARVGGLLTLLTVHRCADLHRERARAARATARAAAREVEDVGVTVCARDEAGRLLGGLGRLGPRERAVLLARAGGQSRRDAARALGVTVRAADCALARARTKLRCAL